MGPCAERGIYDPGHDPGVQLCDHGSDLFPWGNYMVLIFVDPSETDVIDAAQIYFNTVAWCYPFLGRIYLYRNALQGLGYGLVPYDGRGVFELMARWGDRGPGGRKRRFRSRVYV